MEVISLKRFQDSVDYVQSKFYELTKMKLPEIQVVNLVIHRQNIHITYNENQRIFIERLGLMGFDSSLPQKISEILITIIFYSNNTKWGYGDEELYFGRMSYRRIEFNMHKGREFLEKIKVETLKHFKRIGMGTNDSDIIPYLEYVYEEMKSIKFKSVFVKPFKPFVKFEDITIYAAPGLEKEYIPLGEEWECFNL